MIYSNIFCPKNKNTGQNVASMQIMSRTVYRKRHKTHEKQFYTWEGKGISNFQTSRVLISGKIWHFSGSCLIWILFSSLFYVLFYNICASRFVEMKSLFYQKNMTAKSSQKWTWWLFQASRQYQNSEQIFVQNSIHQ